jgi:hypothetical protein
MKKAIIYSAMALATLSMSSCGDSFLLLEPAGAVSETALLSDNGIDMVLTGAYSSLNNMNQTGWMGYAALSNYCFGDVAGADANKGSQSSDQSDFTAIEVYSFSAANSYIQGKWAAVYEAAKRCNNVIDMVEKTENLTNPELIIAQAKFIKGVWMFEGIRMFGAFIPYVSLEDYQASTDPQVTNHKEGSDVADIPIWDLVAKDLKEAAEVLPDTWTNTTGYGATQYGRATKWMAKAMLAKLYLYWSSPYNGKNATDDHWNDCKALLDEIIANGKDAKGTPFKLAKTYGELFNNANTSDWTGESVFDVQLTINGTQTDTNAAVYSPAIGTPGALGLGGWGFYQPTYEFVNSFMVDDNGLPLANYTDFEPLTTMGATAPVTDLDTPLDPRVDYCAGRFGVPYLDYGIPTGVTGWVRDYTNGGLYMNIKYQHRMADRGGTAVATAIGSNSANYHVIRFADILLMRAEVAIHENDLATALDLINQVRARAANSFIKNEKADKTFDNKVAGKIESGAAANYRIGLYTSFANAAEATTALKREMRAEFGMEGHRWFDIARWGEAASVLNAYRAYEGTYFPGKFGNVYNENWVTYPIPITEIQTAMGRIAQNANWK